MDLLLPFGAAPFIWAAARRTPSGGFASQHAAAALFDRMHPRPEQKHELGKLISFMRDGQPPGDEDLASVIEEKRLACIVQGLRWLLVILRHCPTQVHYSFISLFFPYSWCSVLQKFFVKGTDVMHGCHLHLQCWTPL